MKIWLSKNSEIPVREQLAAQITLGIASGDLATGEKLPSTREIARRFTIHSNTVSSVYRKLSADGWLEFRKGSGFYVSEAQTENCVPQYRLDRLIGDFVRKLHELGFSNEEIKKSLRKNLRTTTAQKLILVESDAGFREILAEEIRVYLNVKVTGVSFEEFERKFHKSKAFFVAMFDEKMKMESFLNGGKPHLFLKARSVPATMTGERRPARDDLIAIVSGWEKFLLWSKTILIAAGVEADCLILKDTKLKNWRRGLENAALVICDSLTAAKFSDKQNLRVFPLISEQSLAELGAKFFGKTA